MCRYPGKFYNAGGMNFIACPYFSTQVTAFQRMPLIFRDLHAAARRRPKKPSYPLREQVLKHLRTFAACFTDRGNYLIQEWAAKVAKDERVMRTGSAAHRIRFEYSTAGA